MFIGLRLLAAAVCLAAILVVALSGRGRWSALQLAALAILWLPLNKPMEGLVLLRVTEDQGLTQADLLAPVALLLAAWRWWRSPRASGANKAATIPPISQKARSELVTDE